MKTDRKQTMYVITNLQIIISPDELSCSQIIYKMWKNNIKQTAKKIILHYKTEGPFFTEQYIYQKVIQYLLIIHINVNLHSVFYESKSKF